MDQESGLEKESGQPQENEAVSTAGEPPEKPHPEFEIDIFRDWCKSCGICAAVCPRQCIVMDAEGKPVIDKPKRCTGCRWCELHCPDFAICVKEIAPAGEKKAEDMD